MILKFIKLLIYYFIGLFNILRLRVAKCVKAVVEKPLSGLYTLGNGNLADIRQKAGSVLQ